jgi:cardiolipin synthase
MTVPGWTITAIFFADLAIRIGLSVRVVMRRRPVGVSLAWLFVILVFPFAGAGVYLLIGELRIGRRRTERLRELEVPYALWIGELRDAFTVDWTGQSEGAEHLARLAESAAGVPALPGNELELLGNWRHVCDSLIADLDASTATCHLEFYIWESGGEADAIGEALIRASRRGVRCRVLLDAVGSRPFLHGGLAARMRAAGVELQSALAGGLFHVLVTRFDLRMHRKVAVIDGEIGYVGGMNLADPKLFKQSLGIGQWVDAMVRLRGPAVEALAVTFIADWNLEREDGLETLRSDAVRRSEPLEGPVVQVIPTGPTMEGDAIQILLTTIYAARRTLTITTPYFVPEEALLTALVSAARRGVDVTLLVPERVDSLLVRLASQPHMGELLTNGVKVVLFRGGLLHTKSIVVDREISLIGSLNLDPRSIYLNFEITLAVYDSAFATELDKLHRHYAAAAVPMSLADWRRRSLFKRFLDDVVRLLSPLL